MPGLPRPLMRWHPPGNFTGDSMALTVTVYSD
jgi:hypothetical protein